MSFLRSPTTKNDMCTDVNPHRRVVLLLDMDCFYAQCETVRLGLDQSMPLALVQWRSALAVNYPARKFGIKRGDSFEVIQEKSKGKCVAIHLPVTPVDEQYTTSPTKSPKQHGKKESSVPFNEDWCKAIAMPGYEAVMSKSPMYEVENVDDDNKKDSSTISPRRDTSLESSQSAYDEEFNQPKEVRDEMYKMERNKMRSPSEGKACLDRYRLASSRIFSLIDETLAENIGRKNYILERASIDELFIDVTAFCYQSVEVAEDDDEDGKDKPNNDTVANNKNSSNNDTEKKFRATCDEAAIESLNDTVIYNDSSLDSSDKNDHNSLKLGCLIALTVRRAVLNKLGFTLSAGISTNKLVSKLAATYGKPNGQAVVFPGAISTLMEDTQLRKARMLGGKDGKRVSALLPESETTMGSISRLLSLDQLEKAIGEESARWVFDACRGIDYEEVKPTLKVLPKSITAFKSFPKVSYPELEKWTALLARDIMKRVETDNARNNRIPKAITVGYTMVPGGAWIGRTFRLPFPTDKDFNARIQRLVDSTRNVLTERGHSSFIRIGFSAIDFVVRSKIGIDSFFNKGKTATRSSSTTTKLLVGGKSKKDSGINNFFASKKPPPQVETIAASPKPNSNVNADDNGDTITSGRTPKKSSPKDTSGATPDVGTPKEDDEIVEGTRETTSDITAQSKPVMTDEEMARHLQETYNKEVESQSKVITKTKEKVLGKDEAFALQLQNKFDRENEVLSHVERFPAAKRKSNSSSTASSKKKGSSNKKGKIDFFLKK